MFCGLGILLTWRVAAAGVLRWMYVVYLVACTAAYLVPSSLGENIARLRYAAIPIAILTLSLRRWRPLPVAALRALARGCLEPHPARRQLRQDERRPGRRTPPTGRRRSRFLREQPLPVVPGRGGRHRRPLARRLPPGRRHPDRARLVPAGRLPAQRPALREARPRRGTSPGSGRSASATSCCPMRRSTTAPRQEGALIAGGTLRPRRRRSGRRTRRSTPCRRRAGSSPGRAAPTCSRSGRHRITVALARPGRYRIATNWSPYWTHGRRLPLARRRRDRAPHDHAGRDRAARPVGQCAGCSCGSGRRLEASVRSLSARLARESPSQAVSARHPSAP